MRAEAIATIIESTIPIAGGLYGTLLGFRVVGKKPFESLEYDRWHERFGPMFRVLGPLVILFGVFQLVLGLARAS